VGGPKWDKVPYDVRPEAGLLRLRKDLELFASLRPASCDPALADASSLKRKRAHGVDIVRIRERTAGPSLGDTQQTRRPAPEQHGSAGSAYAPVGTFR